MSPAVRITVITFRRAKLLSRALASIAAQTHANWHVEIINDDPADQEPARVVADLRDGRFAFVEPQAHRGATANFNYAFRSGPETYGSILEDDNWWEPAFLSTMIDALEKRPDAALITGNERIWKEQEDGRWTRTDRVLRPDTNRVWDLDVQAEEKCGGALLANSALLFRLASAANWQTPETIPVDVAEPYRERVIPHPVLVHDRALVNFAETRETVRSTDPFIWNKHQVLLTGSVFELTPPARREALAESLLQRARTPARRGETTSLLIAGLFIPAAAPLWKRAHLRERLRTSVHLVRHPDHARRYRVLLEEAASEWRFLQHGWVADALRQQHQDTHA